MWSGCCSQVKTRNGTLNWLYTFEVLEYLTTDVPKTKPVIFKTLKENNYWESIRSHSWESDHLDSNASESSQCHSEKLRIRTKATYLQAKINEPSTEWGLHPIRCKTGSYWRLSEEEHISVLFRLLKTQLVSSKCLLIFYRPQLNLCIGFARPAVKENIPVCCSKDFLCHTCTFCPLWVRWWRSLGQPGWGRAQPAEAQTGFQLWSSYVPGVPWVGGPRVQPGHRLSCGPYQDRWPAQKWCSQRERRLGGVGCWRLESWGSGHLRCCGCQVGTTEPDLDMGNPELFLITTLLFLRGPAPD